LHTFKKGHKIQIQIQSTLNHWWKLTTEVLTIRI
jgi:hypothetical protein